MALLRRFMMKRSYNKRVTDSAPARILLCDFDGDFLFADELTRLGFLIDQIRPDALRQVAVGDHDLFLFSFETLNELTRVLKTCEKLKFAELETPIVLWSRKLMGPEFLNHQQSQYPANLYINSPDSLAAFLDELARIVEFPIPAHLKTSNFFVEGDIESEALVEEYRAQIIRLEEEIQQLREKVADGEEKSGRESLKPRLKALLEGQKLQFQTESEKIKVQLSEVEAQLLDREAKTQELELTLAQLHKKLDEAQQSHEKAQKTLRAFYLQKLQTVESEKKELEQKISSQSK